MRARSVSLLTLALLAATPAAYAVPRHDSVKVEPIKKGGVVVGAHISMVLTNDKNLRPLNAYVALVTPANRRSLTRAQAILAKLGKLAHQFKPVKRIAFNKPREAEFDLMYQGTNFKSGDHLDVVSAWPGMGAPVNSPHVFGAVLGASRPPGHKGDITLP